MKQQLAEAVPAVSMVELPESKLHNRKQKRLAHPPQSPNIFAAPRKRVTPAFVQKIAMFFI